MQETKYEPYFKSNEQYVNYLIEQLGFNEKDAKELASKFELTENGWRTKRR